GRMASPRIRGAVAVRTRSPPGVRDVCIAGSASTVNAGLRPRRLTAGGRHVLLAGEIAPYATRRLTVDANLHRREFLTRAALLPVGAAVGLTGSAAAQAPIKRVGGAKLKTSLNAYSFNKALNDNLKGRGKGVTLFDLLDYCAEQNFDALDPT